MRLFGLIGYPLSHSFSAKYFETKFAAEKIPDAEYRLFAMDKISLLSDLIDREKELQGFNITIPFKTSILTHLTHISEVASLAGAVNCVKIIRETSGVELVGYNTDVYGFRESLLPLLKPYHYEALILGTGGSAQAVAYVLHELGIGYTMVSRSAGEKSHLQYSLISKEIMSNNLLIINTTPLGMYPETEKFPDIPYHYLNNKHLLYDLIYNPAETIFLQKGREAGTMVKNGLQMLELQAEKSWEIWNG
jgi:shikimate dehydrogenase